MQGRAYRRHLLPRLVGLGLVASSGVVLGRWLTAEPLPDVVLPWDLAVGAALFAVLALPWLRARGGALRHGAPTALALLLLTALFWRSPGFRGQGVFGWLSLGLAAAGALVLLARRRPGRLPEVAAVALAAAGFGLAQRALDHDGAWGLLFPAAAALAAGLGVRAGRGASVAAGAAGAVGLAAFAATVPAPGSGERPPTAVERPAAPGPAVVLVVLDTLRRDHLTVYGYDRPTTPSLEAFAQGARVFDAASADGSWTLPSHASLFTGLPPRTHGAHGLRGEQPLGRAHPLPGPVTTLAEIARARGIATGAVVANHFYLSPRFGLDRGFDTWWAPHPHRGLVHPLVDPLVRRLQPHAWQAARFPYYRAPRITDAARAWLDAREPGQAFLLFVNYMDVHEPNDRPASRDFPDAGTSPEEAGFDPLSVLAGAELPPEVRRYLLNQYDRELAFLDAELGRLLERLDGDDLRDRTTVIVTSDHGEYFGEHGLVEHGRHLHLPVTGVPLLIRGPGIAPGRSDAPVQLSDLFPTILEQLGIDPPERPDARSLLRDGGEGRAVFSEWYPAAGRDVRPEVRARFDREVRAVGDGRFRLYVTGDGAVTLYDVEADPDESHDLAAARPAVVARLRARLEGWKARHPERPVEAPGPGDAPEVDPERLEQLRALGYAD